MEIDDIEFERNHLVGALVFVCVFLIPLAASVALASAIGWLAQAAKACGV